MAGNARLQGLYAAWVAAHGKPFCKFVTQSRALGDCGLPDRDAALELTPVTGEVGAIWQFFIGQRCNPISAAQAR